MGRLRMLFLSIFVIVGFTVSSAMAATVYFREALPGLESGDPITEMTVAPCGDFEFDVWISDVPTGHYGLKTWYLKVWVGNQLESGEQASYVSFMALDGWTVKHMEPGDTGYYGPGWTGIASCPGSDGDVPLVRLTYHCEQAGTVTITPASYYEGLYADFGMCDGTDLWNVNYEGMKLNQVPIPSTALLLGSGLIGLVGVGTRRLKAHK